MFDRAACAGQGTLSTKPFVDMAALSALGNLLADVKAHLASSRVALSGASSASRDQYRGEAHVREVSVLSDVGTAEPDRPRSAAQASARSARCARGKSRALPATAATGSS